ncbi:FecCD family ABC transporter permease [Aliamphritea hakodatensis]|uniref:FecCD family ABC transporter permease n=1 Tax=Aliamphritea hakodatensis TaxID=2895352 RepID=UPI0022FD83AF|nr:iron ABC transporter permease [Aliamphritea hakodatensis]
MQLTEKHLPVRLITGIAIALALLPAALVTGDSGPTPEQLWQWLLPSGNADPVATLIITELRIPRLQTAILTGAALGCAGCLLQRLTRNSLASPGLIGLNQGAALALALLLISPLPFSPVLSFIAAFSGATLAMLAVFVIVRLATGALATDSLLLFGALISTLFAALTSLALILDQHALDAIRFWLAGSLSGVNPQTLPWLAAQVIAGILLAFSLCRPLQLLETGQETARGLGANPTHILLLVSATVLLLTAAAVAVCGPIMFIGLVVPHLARLWLSEQLSWHLTGSIVLGALLLLLADTGVQWLDASDRLPPSTVLAAVGVPWFIWQIRQKYRVS